MRTARLFLSVFLFASAPLAAASVPSAHYSFADLYRVAVGAAPELPAATAPAQPAQGAVHAPASEYQQYQMRVANASAGSSSAGEPPAFTYSGDSLPRPSRWLLILSGLALAVWVARRRLGYSL